MTDFSPEAIAALATRLFNEPPGSPHPAGVPTGGVVQPPPVHTLPPGASAAQPLSGQYPASPGISSASFAASPPIGGLPSPHPAHAAPSGAIPSFPTPPLPDSPPGPLPSQPSSFHLPTGRGIPSLPDSPPGPLPAQPSVVQSPFGQRAPTGGNDLSGLRAFVQNLRATHTGAGVKPATEPFNDDIFRHFVSGASRTSGGHRPFDVVSIRRDFPALNQNIHGKPLVWLDNAATTHKPQSVIDAVSHYYAHDNSNIHRAAHSLAARSTDAYEGAREKVQKFLGAGSVKEIIFVRGTTEGINLIANAYGRKFLQPGDEILLTVLEHHANIVPWQMIAKEKGAVIRVAPVNDRGEVMLEDYQSLLNPRTKLVGLAHANNSLGTILPVHEMTQMAKRYGARVLIDGAQSVAHVPVDVQDLGADFYVFSGHKIFAPTGIGVVYAKEELQEIMSPWQGGGNMIRNVTFEETTYSDPPAKFEAGTPSIGDAVGLGAALDYVSRLGLHAISKYEHELLHYATDKLCSIPNLRLLGTAREKVGVLSFVLPGRKTEEVGRLLDLEGIAVRAGHHCAQPSLRRFGVDSTVRPSLSLYNTKDDVDRLADAVRRIQRG